MPNSGVSFVISVTASSKPPVKMAVLIFLIKHGIVVFLVKTRNCGISSQNTELVVSRAITR